MSLPQFPDALDALARAEVEFVVVGMVAAILQGAPMLTNDVDIVHRRTEENVARLMRVLEDLNAVYRTDRRRLPPQASILRLPGHNLFDTRAGHLDCLGTIDENLGYEDLEPDSIRVELGDGVHCRALGLARLRRVHGQDHHRAVRSCWTPVTLVTSAPTNAAPRSRCQRPRAARGRRQARPRDECQQRCR